VVNSKWNRREPHKGYGTGRDKMGAGSGEDIEELSETTIFPILDFREVEGNDVSTGI